MCYHLMFGFGVDHVVAQDADGMPSGMARAGLTAEGIDSPAAMDVAFKWILLYGGMFSVLLFVVWPLLALPAKVFSKGYFTFWVRLSTYMYNSAVERQCRAKFRASESLTDWE